MTLILGGIILLCLIFGPQLWVYLSIKKHSRDSPSVLGTGAELVVYLAEASNLSDLNVEYTRAGNHYDPAANTVRLDDDVFGKKTLAAVAIAAHELGHAIQKAEGNKFLEARSGLAKTMNLLGKIATGALIAGPILMLILKVPAIGLITTAIYLAYIFCQLALHIVTLPVEFDASFGKALPMLKKMNRFDEKEIAAIREVLLAAALTYVAGALVSILGVFYRGRIPGK